jgi:hypothetical protein
MEMVGDLLGRPRFPSGRLLNSFARARGLERLLAPSAIPLAVAHSVTRVGISLGFQHREDAGIAPAPISRTMVAMEVVATGQCGRHSNCIVEQPVGSAKMCSSWTYSCDPSEPGAPL